MANRVTETLYRVRDGATAVVKRISSAFRSNAATAEQSTTRIEAANRRQRSSLSGVLASVGRLRFAYFAVAGAVAGLVRSASQWTKAASDQEQAEAKLETAIRNGAGATEQEIQALKDLAAERQRVTRFGDEATISAQAQLSTFRLTAEEIALLTPRVQDLAEGTRRLGRSNVDLEQSAILVGKAVSGNSGELSRYGVVLTDVQRELIRTGDQSQKVATLAEALDANFKGLSTSLPPFELALQSTNNAVGDFGEKMGFVITNSPAVVDALNRIRDMFSGLGESVTENAGTLERWIAGIIAGVRVLENAVSVIFNGITIAANRFARAVIGAAKGVVDVLAAITPGELGEKFEQVSDRAASALEDLQKRSERAYESMGKSASEFVEAGRDLNEALFQNKEAQEAANAAQQKSINQAAEQAKAEAERAEALEKTQEILEAIGVDAAKVNTRVSSAAQESHRSLVELAQQGQSTAAVLQEAAFKASREWDHDELEAFRQTLRQANESGKISEYQFRALRAGIADLEDGAAKASKVFNDLSTAIAKAASLHDLQNLTGQVNGLRDAGEISTEEFNTLKDTIKKGRDEITGLGGDADETGEKGKEAGEKTGDSFEGAGKKAGDTADEVEKVGDTADQAARSSAGMSASIADMLAGTRKLSEGASQAVDQLLERIVDGATPVGIFFEQLNKGLAQIQQQYGDQVEAFEEIEQRLAQGADAADVYNSAVLAATAATQLLDQQRLDRLNAIIAEARREMEQARAETRRWIDDINQAADAAERRVRELRGEREQLELEDQQATIRELEKKIREAGALGVDTPPAVLEDLKRRLDAEKEVLDILRQQAKEAEAERKRAAQEARQGPSRASGAGSAPQDAQNATGAPAPGLPGSGQVFTINLAIGGRTFPGQFSPADARALAEILRRSGNNTLPNQAP